MKSRFAVQEFLHLPEFSRSNTVMGVVDPSENEGYLKFQFGAEMFKLEFYSLNISGFRNDAIHQLTKLIKVCTETRNYLESMPAPEREALPAIGSGKTSRLVNDGSDAVHTPD